MYNLTAVIPVRKGSRRLPNKNIAPFAGTTLLEHKIRVLKNVSEIDNIVVSSDCDYMLSLASSMSVNVHKRAIEYCDEKSKSFGEVVHNICSVIDSKNIIWTPVTAPLITVQTYNDGIADFNNFVLDTHLNDSLITVHGFKNYLLNSNGPLNYEYGLKHVPSQHLEELYILTAGYFIAKRDDMIKWSYLNGPNPYMKKLDRFESVDIDDEFDLELAKYYYDKYLEDKFLKSMYF